MRTEPPALAGRHRPARSIGRPRPRRAGALGVVLLAWLALAVPARALQWYEHYENGLAAETRGAWTEALESFREAERFRPEPSERVRTYGNRFLFDYDPPFHAARCLLELGRWDEARAALGRSAAAGVTPEAERAALADRLERAERLDRRARRESATATPAAGARTTPAHTTPDRPAPAGPPPAEAPSEAAVDRTAGAPASADAPARLVVESTPSGAAVTVDGRAVGRTPLDGIDVAPGERRLRVSGEALGEGWGSWEQTVDARPGERIHVEVALSRPPPRPTASEPAATGSPGPAAHPEGFGVADSTGSARSRGSDGEAGAAGDGAESGTVAGDEDGQESSGGASEPSDLAAPAAAPGTARPATDGEAGRPAADRARPGPLGRRAALVVAIVALGGGLVWWTWWTWRRVRRRGGSFRAGSATDSSPGWGSGWGAGRVGERVGGYRLDAVLGRGGMATTYRAERVGDRRPVALKIPHETGDPTYLERFLREGRLGETLHHPGIVRIIEAGTVRAGGAAEDPAEGPAGREMGRPFLAMELLPGKTLRQVLDEAAAAGEPLAVERCLEIAVEIAEALDYAHGKGVIHRDLKPENVMVLPDGSLRVMDFGVARVEGQPGLTTSRFFFGSPVYAAPELVDPRTIDRRADLYSLGVLLFELLEGEPPFVHESIFKLIEMHQSAPLPAPGELARALPPDLWRVVARLLAKDREERYGSAQELLVDLHRLMSAPTSPSAPARRR